MQNIIVTHWVELIYCRVRILIRHYRAWIPISILDRLSKKKSRKKMTKKILIGPSVFTISVCVCACVSVSALQVTVFGVGSWFLVWRTLAVIPKNEIFCFLKFWFLTYLWLFLDIFGVFSYIFSINFKRVSRSNRMT